MCVPVEAGKMIFIGFLILVHITWCSAHPAGCDDKGPICGNDGMTYRSMCQLIWARFEDPDLAVLHDGGCTGKYASPDLPQSSIHNDGTFPEKMLLSLKTKTNRNHDKIRAIMPVGWPPLGPANRQKEQKRRIIKKDRNQG